MSVPTRAIRMYKAPELGCSKTRLARSVGDWAALKIYRWMGIMQLNVIPAEWEMEIRFSPVGHKSLMRGLLDSRTLMRPQGERLGNRMIRPDRSHLEDGFESKIIFWEQTASGLTSQLCRRPLWHWTASTLYWGPQRIRWSFFSITSRRMSPLSSRISPPTSFAFARLG